MIYEKHDGRSGSVYIENIDENNPYTCVGAKAFLSCKNVYEIKLPDTICEIGDWAFAHMKELKKLIVPAKKISLGKDVFLDCDNIKEIIVYPGVPDSTGIQYLLAACVTILKSFNLLDFEMVSENSEAWYGLYDKELINFISRADESGFQPVMVGWFNDEGEDVQLDRHLKKVKADKINLCYLRLKYDSYIADNTREQLISYLREQIKKSDTGDDLSWTIIRDVLSGDLQYVKLSIENELLDEELTLNMIDYLNENNASTEITAYLVLSLEDKKKNIDQLFEL